jgi:hypothetical protein
MQKSYVYKWYTGTVFNGVLTNVISKYSLSEEINTAGSSMEVDLGIALEDASPTLTKDYLVTDDGDYVVTDDSEKIIVGTDTSITGFPALNDRIEVWEFSDDYPNGFKKFNGLVSKWSSDYKNKTTRLSLLSYGVELDNQLVQITANTTLVSNTTTDSSEVLYSQAYPTLNRIISVAQTFTVGTTSDITSISVIMGNSGSFSVSTTVSIYEGTPTSVGATIATVTRSLAPQAEQSTTFQLSAPTTLSVSTDYFLLITNNEYGISETNTLTVAYNSSSVISGTMHTNNDTSGWSSTSYDLGFTIVTSSGGIGNQFLSQDPGSIVRTLLDTYADIGGTLSYTTSTVQLTSTTVSYTFKFNKYLEAIKKSVELAPANWWWYADPSNDTLYFKPLSTTTDHTLVLGKHLSNIVIDYSLEEVVNVAYLSGGDTGSGTNLLEYYSDAESISQYGTWLRTRSDNRVTSTATANILNESFVNQYKDPRFKTSITLLSSVYDFNLVRIGDVIGFRNFNSLIDSLQLQVMAKKDNSDTLELTLAILPPNITKRVEDLRRNMEKQQTENNPTS